MKKNINILAFFLIHISNLLLFVETQIDDESALKALSCVSLVTQKYKVGEEEPTSYSPIVLSCYVKITTEQAKRVLNGMEEDIDELDPEEIEALTDLDNLKELSEDEIKQKSEELEKTIQEFQKIDQEYEKDYEDEMMDYDDDGYIDDYDDDDDEFGINKKKKLSKKGILGLVKKGFSGLFKVASSVWYAIFILICLYFLLMAFRKTSEEMDKVKKKEKDDKKEDIKDDNKNNGENEKEDNKNKEKDKEKNKEQEKEKEKIE